MNNLYARAVFFVPDAGRALAHYTERLGFAKDWAYEEEGHTYVCQVSLLGFGLILNEVDAGTRDRAGHGRVFIGLDPDQVEPLHRHFAAKGIEPEHVDWGRPTQVIRDPEGNELFFWMPRSD